jgi:hypothetical protein
MARLKAINLGRLILGLLLCLSLWGCGVVNPQPPKAAVESAIAQKVAQTQSLLSRQLALREESSSPAQVGRVKVTGHHWTTIANQPAVEVEGTYQLQGGGLTRAQQRQERDFSLYLKRGDTKDEWILVEPAT